MSKWFQGLMRFSPAHSQKTPGPDSVPSTLAPISKPLEIVVIAEDPLLVDIPDLGFLGGMSFSDSKEFAVAYGDSCKTEGGWRAGARDSGEGDVLLLNGGHLLWRKKIPRPFTVAISDKGDVLICDVGFGARLNSTMWVFGANGAIVVRQPIEANLLSCAVTPGGDYGFFNSAASDNENHSCKLFTYSIASGAAMFIVDFPITTLEKAASGCGMVVITADGIPYQYSLQGKLLNRVETDLLLFEKAIAAQWFPSAYFIVNRSMSAPELTPENRALLLNAYERLAASDAPPEYRAKCQREIGQEHLSRGEKELAVARFREALKLNPKIGLKRKLAELEKKLSGA